MSAQEPARVRFVAPATAAAAAAIAVLEIARRWGGAGSAEPQAIMAPATAVGVLLAAGSLLMVRAGTPGAAVWAGRVLALATAALGILAMGVRVIEWAGASGDGLLGPGLWPGQRRSRMSGPGLALIGTALFAVCSARRRVQRWADLAAALLLVVALVALAGHVYGAGPLYGLTRSSAMAASTAIAFGLLGIGAIYAHPTRGIAAIWLSNSAGGHLLRRLAPLALLAPLLLGWIALAAYQRGYVNAGFAAAALVAFLIVLLVGVLVRQAMVLHAIDAERDSFLVRERQASRQISSILESITDAFFAVDPDWRFSYVNREAERLLQRSREELIGESVWSEFSSAVGSVFEREYMRAMSERTTARFEAFYPPLNAWFDVRAFPSGNGLSIYFSNVTDRKLAEERLRESEERLRLLADMVPQHIWRTNANGYHTYFSRRWYEFTGMKPGEGHGEGWLTRLHPEDREQTLARWNHSLRTGEPYSVEYRFRGATGDYRWFLGQAMPNRDESGRIVEWFGTLTDISQRKQHDEERERLLRRLQESLAESRRRREQLERVTESRNLLMRGFSHDVKNPLGAADGHAALLVDGILGELSEQQTKSVQRIRSSIATALHLIEDLLELARAESGQIEIECVRTDVVQAAREVVEEFRAQAAAAGVAIDVDAAAHLLAETDPMRVRQILANLLSNAVKYAPGTHTTVCAQIARNGHGPRPGDWITLSVSDAGPGIPKDKQEAIFQEFTRLQPQAKSGAGVGLAISRRIARAMGGDLTVESDVGQGATFTLWLPPAG